MSTRRDTRREDLTVEHVAPLRSLMCAAVYHPRPRRVYVSPQRSVFADVFTESFVFAVVGPVLGVALLLAGKRGSRLRKAGCGILIATVAGFVLYWAVIVFALSQSFT